MSGAGDAPAPSGKAELRVVGTTVARETDALLERLATTVGRRAPRILQVGSRTLVADRNVRNWRSLVHKRIERARFVGIELEAGRHADHMIDI